MGANSPAVDWDAEIWQRATRFEGQLTPSATRALLKLGFDEADHDRMAELAAKARSGKLSSDERRQTEAYERLGCLLDILHSQARRALKRRKAS